MFPCGCPRCDHACVCPRMGVRLSVRRGSFEDDAACQCLPLLFLFHHFGCWNRDDSQIWMRGEIINRVYVSVSECVRLFLCMCASVCVCVGQFCNAGRLQGDAGGEGKQPACCSKPKKCHFVFRIQSVCVSVGRAVKNNPLPACLLPSNSAYVSAWSQVTQVRTCPSVWAEINCQVRSILCFNNYFIHSSFTFRFLSSPLSFLLDHLSFSFPVLPCFLYSHPVTFIFFHQRRESDQFYIPAWRVSLQPKPYLCSASESWNKVSQLAIVREL